MSGDERAPDPTARFTGRAEAYACYRPGYPIRVLDILREKIGLLRVRTVADLGSGTGLSSELFLAAGHSVYGVEPNPEMRAAAESRLREEPRFHSVDGRAEATGLASDSIDLVVAGQAFHWFDPELARRECVRILRGRHALLLFNARRTEGSPFLEAYEALLRCHGTDYARARHDRGLERALARFYPEGYGRRMLPNEQLLDRDGLVGRTVSCSYVPGPDHPAHQPLREALDRLFERHAREGFVRLEYRTEIYFGRLR